MNRKFLFTVGVIVILSISMIFLTGQAPAQFHNPQTGRMHGDYPYMLSYRPNDTVTGTMQYRLVAGTGTPSKAIVASVGAMGILGICAWNCGTSGDAAIARLGDILCDFDGPTTARNLVIPSVTEAGKCHDAGVNVQDDPWPLTNRIIGVVASTNASAGTYTIAMYPNGTRGHVEGVKGSATLDFPSLGGGLCTDLTMTVTGAVEGKPVLFSLPADLSAATRSTFNAWVSAADTVTIRHCSINGSNNPPSAVYNVVVMANY